MLTINGIVLILLMFFTMLHASVNSMEQIRKDKEDYIKKLREGENL